MSRNQDHPPRSLWEVVKEVSEEENPEKITQLVRELNCLLEAGERSVQEKDEAR